MSFPWNHPVVPIVVLWLICAQPAAGNVVMSSKPSTNGGQVGEGVGVPLGLGVGVGQRPVLVVMFSVHPPERVPRSAAASSTR